MSGNESLKGKRAFVTGASSGIGRAIAIGIAEHGGDVALCGRQSSRLHETAEAIQNEGGRAEIVEADFFEEGQIIQAMAKGAGSLGGLEILINSAGIGRQATLIDGNTSDWAEMMNINVLALAIAQREALRFFPENGGQIINISSLSGHRVPGRGGFYAATKFAVRAITEGLRQELRFAGNLTRVSSISPGFVETPLLDDYFNSNNPGAAKREDSIKYPILQPEDVARVAIQQLTAPPNVDITDVLLRPTQQPV